MTTKRKTISGMWVLVEDILFKFRDIDRKLDKLLTLGRDIKTREVRIMATLDDVLAGVAEENTQIDSLAVLVANIKKQLDAIIAGGLTPEAQAKVDALFAGILAGKQKVQDAINANTPQA